MNSRTGSPIGRSAMGCSQGTTSRSAAWARVGASLSWRVLRPALVRSLAGKPEVLREQVAAEIDGAAYPGGLERI